MTTARPFSQMQDPFAFEIGWVNALALVLALSLLLLSAGSKHVPPGNADEQAGIIRVIQQA